MSTPQDWGALVHAAMQSDISDVLPDLDTPLLLTHPRDFGVEIEKAQRVAIASRNARLVVVQGNFFPEPEQGLTTLQDFLASVNPPSADASRQSSATPMDGLSVREVEVLRLLARGKSNVQIAEELVISPNTVNRHVSNIYSKTGAANRVEAASYATRNGLA